MAKGILKEKKKLVVILGINGNIFYKYLETYDLYTFSYGGKLSIPYLVAILSSHLSGDGTYSSQTIYVVVAFIPIIILANIFLSHYGYYNIYLIAALMKASTMSLIYKKVLKLQCKSVVLNTVMLF